MDQVAQVDYLLAVAQRPNLARERWGLDELPRGTDVGDLAATQSVCDDRVGMKWPSTWRNLKPSAVTREEGRMASLGSGVELRAKVIRIQFSLNGEAVRRTLKREHRALAPTPEKLAVLQELGGRAAGLLGVAGHGAAKCPPGRQPRRGLGWKHRRQRYNGGTSATPTTGARRDCGPKRAAGSRGCVGVADGTRTHDDQNHNLGLYQLSYSHHWS